nr:cyclic GMP-AMP synthase-like [Microcebus murinus]
MDPQRGKATPAAWNAGAAVPMVLARSWWGARTEPRESPAAPRAAQAHAGSGGCAWGSGSQQLHRAQEQWAWAEGLEPLVFPGPPLPWAGFHPAGGARCPWEQTLAPRPAKVPRLGPRVPAASLGRGEAAPGGWKLRAVLEKLKLSRQEVSDNAQVVNRVVDHLLERLQSRESEFKGISKVPLRTGSYYERVKISVPNEFDVMFKLEVPRIELEEYANSGVYYFVKFRINPIGNPLSPFLSASKVLWKFRDIIKEEIKDIEGTDVIVEKKRGGSPAVTLLIGEREKISVDIILALESTSSWPPSTQEGMPISKWLGPKIRDELRRQPFYLVPKHAKEANGFQEETWRLSFSHIEKQILKDHGKGCCEEGEPKCCRKGCLKLMKYLLEQLKKKFENRKELNKFCSYHVKTAFFHVCTQYYADSQWRPQYLEVRFDDFVTYFLECLRTEQLRHYFVPAFNLFSPDQIDKTSKEFLSKQIEYERNNGFPIFRDF